MKNLVSFITFLVTGFIMALFIFPEAGRHYHGFWYAYVIGCAHGSLVLQNWVYSLFSANHLVKAPSATGAYYFWWWAGAIMTYAYLIFLTYAMIKLRRLLK